MKLGKKFLITTDDWFRAPNGRNYKSVYGTVKGVLSSEETLGIKTNAKSTNWYVQIGNMIVAGCQIHYAIETEHVNLGKFTNQLYNIEHGAKLVEVDSEIYNADDIYKHSV
jgi:hypothetical protein